MFRTGKHLHVKISFVYREHRTAKMFWLYFAIPFFSGSTEHCFSTMVKFWSTLVSLDKGVSTGCQTVSPQSSYRILLGHRNIKKAKGEVTTKLSLVCFMCNAPLTYLSNGPLCYLYLVSTCCVEPLVARARLPVRHIRFGAYYICRLRSNRKNEHDQLSLNNPNRRKMK